MKKFEIDSLFGIYANLLLAIMLLFAWAGEDIRYIVILPFVAILVEIFVLLYDFDAKKFQYKKEVIIFSKLLLILAPLLVLIINTIKVCLFCEEVRLLNLVLISFVVVQLLAIIYVRVMKKV